MSESEKKGSAWPWIAVPIAAVSLFFVLRECQHRLPPAGQAPAVAAPPAPETPASDPPPADPDAAPAPAPAPQ
jgi:hypothetical protein